MVWPSSQLCHLRRGWTARSVLYSPRLGRDAHGIPERSPDLTWRGQSRESGEWAPVCSQGPSAELCVSQHPSKKQKAYLDVILDCAFISRVVSLIYLLHHKLFPQCNGLEQQACSVCVWVVRVVQVSPGLLLKQLHCLMGQLAGLPGPRLGWDAGPLSTGSFIPGCFRAWWSQGSVRMGRRREALGWGPATSFLPLSIGQNNLQSWTWFGERG